MTYANDCIQAEQDRKRCKLKRIEHHTATELDAAVEMARRKFGDDFWLLLHGIDAYQERRRQRKERRRQLLLDRVLNALPDLE